MPEMPVHYYDSYTHKTGRTVWHGSNACPGGCPTLVPSSTSYLTVKPASKMSEAERDGLDIAKLRKTKPLPPIRPLDPTELF